MKIRIALWTFAGLLVAAAWWVYAWATAPVSLATLRPLWMLAQFSCPLVFVGTYFHFGVSVYSVFVSNAAVYALLGLLVEILRAEMRSSHSSAALG